MKAREYVYFETNDIYIDEASALIETRAFKGFDACMTLLVHLLFGLYRRCFRSYAEGAGRAVKVYGERRREVAVQGRKKADKQVRNVSGIFTITAGTLDKIRLDKIISTTTVVEKERPEAEAVVAGKKISPVSGDGQTLPSATCRCRVPSRRSFHPVWEKPSPRSDEIFSGIERLFHLARMKLSYLVDSCVSFFASGADSINLKVPMGGETYKVDLRVSSSFAVHIITTLIINNHETT